jgi:hypothetical protein
MLLFTAASSIVHPARNAQAADSIQVFVARRYGLEAAQLQPIRSSSAFAVAEFILDCVTNPLLPPPSPNQTAIDEFIQNRRWRQNQRWRYRGLDHDEFALQLPQVAISCSNSGEWTAEPADFSLRAVSQLQDDDGVSAVYSALLAAAAARERKGRLGPLIPFNASLLPNCSSVAFDSLLWQAAAVRLLRLATGFEAAAE